MDKYLDSFREMISLRGLTGHTLKNYCTYIRAYLDYLANILHKAPEEVSWNELRDYICWLQKSRGLSDRTINCAISQLRFFTLYVLHKPWDDTQLPFRRFDEYLPYVPSQEQTWQFISSMPDLKPKTMVTLMYSSGLYWFKCGRPMGYLFPKQRGEDRPIDTFFLSRHIHAHEDRLGLERRLTCHSFRHAFGTHLYENGTDLLTIKALMGHKSLQSTTIYVHLSGNSIRQAVSPLDYMAGVCHE